MVRIAAGMEDSAAHRRLSLSRCVACYSSLRDPAADRMRSPEKANPPAVSSTATGSSHSSLRGSDHSLPSTYACYHQLQARLAG